MLRVINICAILYCLHNSVMFCSSHFVSPYDQTTNSNTLMDSWALHEPQNRGF